LPTHSSLPCTACSRAATTQQCQLGQLMTHSCLCGPCVTPSSTGFGGLHCRVCPAGTYSPGGDKNQPRPKCLKCPPTSIGSPEPGAIDIYDCGGCKAGFGGDDCRVCPPNTFSTGLRHCMCSCRTGWQGSNWQNTLRRTARLRVYQPH
jgi:hypothetical protein